MTSAFWFDVKYAWRLVTKTPGHSLLCVVVVALSMGLAIWNYEGTYTMLFKPLPFSGSDHWYSIQIARNATADPQPNVDAYTYQEILKRNRGVHHLGAYQGRAAVLTEGQASTSLRAAAISPTLFNAMGTAPLAGRLFGESDGQAGAEVTAILSFAAWQGYFAADPHVVGKSARIDGQPVRIIGVMPRDFFAFQDFELWLPLQPQLLTEPGDSSTAVAALLRLDEAQQVASVSASLTEAVTEVNRLYPTVFNTGRHVTLVPAHRMLTPPGYVQIAAMNGFIALAVLLLGCVNISLICFSRLLERKRELALRTALGSPLSRLLRQALLESVFVVAIGLVIGVGLAAIGVHWAKGIGDIHAQVQAVGRDPNQFSIRAGDVGMALLAATLVWLLSTLLPAWRIARQDATVGLAGSGKGTAVAGNTRTVTTLVGFEVLISCLVLVICANVVYAVKAEVDKATGLNSSGVMIATQPTAFDGRYAQPTERTRYWTELRTEIRARVSGAVVGYAGSVPTEPTAVVAAIEHQEGPSGQGTLRLPVTEVSDNYFAMLGIERRSGRLFDSTDASGSGAVAVVDESLATRYWPGQDPVGKQIRLNPQGGGPKLTIVGVVSSVTSAYSTTVGVVYRPLLQAAPPAFHLLVKFPDSGSASRSALRAAAYAVNRDLPLRNLQMLGEYLDADNLDAAALIPVFTVIGIITVILAGTGLFGLISRSVVRRTQEAGVRRALGGTRWQVTSVFLRQPLALLGIAAVGGVLGVMVTNLLSAAIPNILIRVAPVTAAVFLLMTAVIFLSSYLPTRRATSLEPMDALRYE